jgi:uncharacterized membrane protein (DUF485 family)
MNSETEGFTGSDHSSALDRFRERFATWASFALILVFFIITIALWSYAAWWCVAKLIGLVF